MSPDPKATLSLLSELSPYTTYGKVIKIVGLVAEGTGIKAPLGSLCHIQPESLRAKNTQSSLKAGSNTPPGSGSGQGPSSGSEAGSGGSQAKPASPLVQQSENEVPVEVVGFRDGNLLFMPYGDLRGVQPGSLVRNSSLPPLFPAGPGLLGRAFDAFGSPMSG